MTALIGYAGMFLGLLGIGLLCALLHKMWEIGLLQAILSITAIGIFLYCLALAIHDDAIWVGEKIQGVF